MLPRGHRGGLEIPISMEGTAPWALHPNRSCTQGYHRPGCFTGQSRSGKMIYEVPSLGVSPSVSSRLQMDHFMSLTMHI